VTEIAASAVQEIAFNFMQRCFIGAAPNGKPEEKSISELRELLCSIDELLPMEVHTWSEGRRTALYRLLSNFVIILQLQPGLQFPGEVRSSMPDRLRQPLMSLLGTAPDPSDL